MVEDTVLEKYGRPEVDPFKDTSTVKVMLSEPSGGYVDCMVHDNRLDFYMALARMEGKTNFKFFTGNVGRMQVSYAREMMCDEAIRQGMDYLLMIDDDQIVPKDMFERLYRTMEDKKADIVAPVVTQRLFPFHPVIYKHSFNDDGPGKRSINNEFISDYEPNSVVKCDGMGFGVVLLRVATIKKIAKPRFFSNTHIGEDIWFCIKARAEADAQAYVDTSIKVGHLRPPEIASEYDWVKAKGLEEKFKTVYPKSREEKMREFNEIASVGK